MEHQGNGKNPNKNDLMPNMNYPNQFRMIMDWWQQNSPIAWSEMYTEYITYVTSMTEIYKEYSKPSEKTIELYRELAINTERILTCIKSLLRVPKERLITG